MITVDQAVAIIQSFARPFPTEEVQITEVLGRILRMPINADRDFPPYNRVTMDGIAINYEAFATGVRSFPIQDVQFAGSPQKTLTDPNHCLEVMTGSVCPNGSDTIIRYEDIEITKTENGSIATVTIDEIKASQNVHFQGNDRKAGEELVDSGRIINAPEIAVAASVGQDYLTVSSLPKIAILSSGDELVPISNQPLPHQIRRSNSYMLQAALSEMGITSVQHHLPDDQGFIEKKVSQLLTENDVIILTGGVSKGKADFIPEALEKAGVKKQFHKVKQRPGKPLWFGLTDNHKVVFALPGNPVSSFVGFHRYVKPWLKTSLVLKENAPITAELAAPVTFNPDLTYFIQVRLYQKEDGKWLGTPMVGGGSGDFANLLDGNAFMELPLGRSNFEAGESFPVFTYRDVFAR